MWFGLVQRWHVHSIRGGPTLPLRKFEELIYIKWIDAVRSAAYTSNLLSEIGAPELRNCDVGYFLECVERLDLDWSACQHRLVHRLAFWKTRRMSPEELRGLLMELGE